MENPEIPPKGSKAIPGSPGPIGKAMPPQLNVSLSPDQREWITKLSKELAQPASLGDAVRWVIDRARADRAESELKSRTNRRTKFLEGIRLKFYPELAAMEASVKPSELAEWLNETDFVETVENEQGIYRAILQDQLRKIGEGSNKGGNASALVEILKAVAPEYGRLKMELIQRSENRMVKDIFKILADEFGPSQQEMLSRALQKINDKLSLRITDYAE